MLLQKCRTESWESGCGLYMGVGTRDFQGHEIVPPSGTKCCYVPRGGIRPLGGGGSSSCSVFYEQQDPVFSARWDGNPQALYLYADICWSLTAGVTVQVNLFFQVLPFLSATYKQIVLRAISLPRWCHQHRTNPLCFSEGSKEMPITAKWTREKNLFQLLMSFLLANFTFQVIFVELAAKFSHQSMRTKCVSLKLESSYIYK